MTWRTLPRRSYLGGFSNCMQPGVDLVRVEYIPDGTADIAALVLIRQFSNCMQPGGGPGARGVHPRWHGGHRRVGPDQALFPIVFSRGVDLVRVECISDGTADIATLVLIRQFFQLHAAGGWT